MKTINKILFVLLFFVMIPLASADINKSLHHWYYFDDNSLKDYNTSNNNATFTAGIPAYSTIGNLTFLNKALHINGSISTTTFNASSQPGVNIDNTFRTVTFWMNTTIDCNQAEGLCGIITNRFQSTEVAGDYALVVSGASDNLR